MFTIDDIRSLSMQEIQFRVEAADDKSPPIPVSVVRYLLRRAAPGGAEMDYGEYKRRIG